MTSSGDSKETLSGRIERVLKARVVALAEKRNVTATAVMSEALEIGVAYLEGKRLNGQPVAPASPLKVVGGQATPLEVQAHLQAIEKHCRAHARANRLSVQGVLGILMADASTEQRAAARQFLEQSFAGLEPLEQD